MSPAQSKLSKGSSRSLPKLSAPGWNPETKRGIEQLIQKGAGKGEPVVFDFDNTIVCGDIADATVAVLAKTGLLDAGRLPSVLCPSFRNAAGREVSLATAADAVEYYEALLSGPTVHGDKDPAMFSNGHTWAVEILQGLTVLDVVKATQTAFEFSKRAHPYFIQVSKSGPSYPTPFFYEAILELLANLLQRGFDVWIISASPVWCVRWMVMHGLNPRLKRFGIKDGIAPNRILGISTLMADAKNRLHKDDILVREDKGYAGLKPNRLQQYRLTSRLQFPVSTYSGKVGCIWDKLGRKPYLCVGDSPGDLPMLGFSENRLWLARLENPNYQKLLLKTIQQTGRAGWWVQPTLCSKGIGFIPALSAPAAVLKPVPQDIRRSIATLSRSRLVA
jgi:phosphoserine phosphatase